MNYLVNADESLINPLLSPYHEDSERNGRNKS